MVVLLVSLPRRAYHFQQLASSSTPFHECRTYYLKSGLNEKIKEVTVDLKFRGDYTPTAREYLQESIANNDLGSFKKIITNKSLWAKVPVDRFDKRVKYVM
ncbi:hypothetical protein JZN52_004401 [Vibrio vulnificus]|nr:hypothetical protein [Vibrio vulnificus]